jgi:hypothetical protein
VSEVSPFQAPERKEIGWGAYVCGGLAFIPCLGVPFGVAAIVLGILRKARAPIILGALGIAFTVILYGSLFYFGMIQRGGIYDQLRGKLAVTMLDSTVKEIEYYKVQHGYYPKSLDDLADQEKDSFASSVDPTAIQRGGKADEKFFYQLDPSGKFYYLRSVGPDGIPFTADDILPSLPLSETQNTGLRLEKPDQQTSPPPAH